MKVLILKVRGTVGIITYLTYRFNKNVSDEAVAATCTRIYWSNNYGDRICCGQYSDSRKNKKKIQDAHEAIRPTDISLEHRL